MNAKQIKELFEKYKSFLRSNGKNDRLHLWESQLYFQKHWNIDATDFHGMYDSSLQNSVTKRLWKREAYEPKRMMMEFIKMDPEWTRQTFKELFDENRTIEGRAGRFIFYCDHLLETYKNAHPLSIDNNHYHEDGYQMVFLYLAFRYPELYAPYQHEPFVNLLKKVGAVNPPLVPDVERFSKVCRTLFKMMQNDSELIKLHQQRLIPGQHYEAPGLMIVYDFYMSVEF